MIDTLQQNLTDGIDNILNDYGLFGNTSLVDSFYELRNRVIQKLRQQIEALDAEANPESNGYGCAMRDILVLLGEKQ